MAADVPGGPAGQDDTFARAPHGREHEADLVRRAKAGDEPAFETLYQANRGQVFRAIAHVVKDDDTADWLANAALSRAWEKLDTFHGDSAFGTWVVRIGINLGLGHLRKEKRTLQFWRDPRLSSDERGDPVDAEERVAAAEKGHASVEDRQVLDMAIARVPFVHRELLRRRFWEGLEVEDIMRRTGASKAAVKCRIGRARRALQSQIRSLSHARSSAKGRLAGRRA